MNRVLDLQKLATPAPGTSDVSGSTSSYVGCTCSTSSNTGCSSGLDPYIAV